MLANWLRLRRQAHAPRELDGTETIYAAADGTLKHMDPEGNLSNVAGEGSLPSPTTEGDVLTVVEGEWAGAAPGGGSQAALTLAAFRFTEAESITYAITAVEDGGGTVVIAGDHVDEFPSDSTALVYFADGDDATSTYAILSATLVGGSTKIGIDGTTNAQVGDHIVGPRVHTATLDVEEGTVVVDVVAYAYGAWTAPHALIRAGDGNNAVGYINERDMGGGSNLYSAYDPASLDPTANYLTAAIEGAAYGLAAYSQPEAGGVAKPGPGVRYDSADIVTIKVYQYWDSAPSGDPAGDTLIVVWYSPAPTETEATVA